jgi:hypothetical protein
MMYISRSKANCPLAFPSAEKTESESLSEANDRLRFASIHQWFMNPSGGGLFLRPIFFLPNPVNRVENIAYTLAAGTKKMSGTFFVENTRTR